jgi:carbon storage regulator
MLVLTRKPNERIMIGDSVCVTILKTQGRRVRLGIEAPAGVTIIRGEILGRPMAQESAAVKPGQTAQGSDS